MKHLFRTVALAIAIAIAATTTSAQAALNTHLSDAAANAEANALAPLLNNGFLEIFDGSQPANGNTAVTTQNLIVTLTFGSTAFGASSGGIITANAIGSAAAVFSSTATWFRAFKSDGTTVVFDGSVCTSGCNLNLSSAVIASGTTVSISAFTHTVTE